MKRIVLCTSSSGLDYVDKPDNIRILRHHIEVYGQKYRDGDDISYQDMADAMIADNKLVPETAPQSVDELLQIFEDLYEEGFEEIFVVTLSSRISTAYEYLMEARGLFDKGLFIHIYDSRSVSYPEAYMALEAARLVDAEKSAIEVFRHLDKIRDNNIFWLVIDDLTNLIRTKRLSAPAGLIANMLNIKPLLEIDEDGVITPIERVRKIDKAVELMRDYAIDAINESPGQMYIVNTGNAELVEKVKGMLAQEGLTDLPVYPTASAAIANHGPHGAGIGIIYDS